MRYTEEATFQTMVLEKVKVQANAMLSPEFALRPDVRVHLDHMTQRLMLQLRAEVLEDPRHRDVKTLRFTEQPVYRNWKQHLVASLPVDSFRRRFLERFWEIDEPNGTRIVHEVTVDKRAVFPGNRMEYPKDLGPVQYVVSDRSDWWSEEA